jgi:hypothetical protein
MAERHFLDSWKSLKLDESFDFVCVDVKEEYGTFGEKKFNESYNKEIEAMWQLLMKYRDRFVVWSDVDMRIYKNPLPDLLGRWDGANLWTSMDSPVGVEPADHCTGFQFFLVTQKMINFYRLWMEVDAEKEWGYSQQSFNEALRRMVMVDVKPLPKQYWTIGLEGQKVWSGRNLDDIPNPPQDIILHHANYTIGFENKMKLLDEIKEKVSAQRVM